MNMPRFWKAVILILFAAIAAFLFLKVIPSVPHRPEPSAPTVPPAETTLAPPPTEASTEPTEFTAVPETVPAPADCDTVPQYFQTDYPFIKYGNDTIGTSGCSITCMAMVATYLTDHPYMPDELAYHFGSYGKNNIERLEYTAGQLGLPYEKNFDWRETKEALAAGKVAIVMENGNSPFTDQQHFIVLTGLTEDGKVLIHDPFEPNYSNEQLKDGFLNGFGEYAVTSGYSGGWVFDKSAIPEDLTLYDASKPELPESRYVGYELPEEDIYELACFAWTQVRDESEEVQQAVLEVILNRLVSEKYPNTVHAVIFSSEMYRNMDYAAPDFPQYRAVTAAMYGPYLLPMDVYSYAPTPAYGTVWGEIGNYTFLYS